MSCLFDSLSFYITNINSKKLRNIITDYLSENPLLLDDAKFSELIGVDKFDNYISNMRKDSTWGGAYEIKAFCDLFDAKVKVKILQTNKWIEFLPKNYKNNLPEMLITWNGSHYEPIKDGLIQN